MDSDRLVSAQHIIAIILSMGAKSSPRRAVIN